MCTAYQVGKRSLPKRIELLNDAPTIASLQSDPVLMRPTNLGPVLMPGGEIEVMRWGFERAWSKAIVNSRDDKLGGAVWRDAFESRRCLLPMTSYYEWSGPTGKKITHRFTPNHNPLFWAAGIWEEHATHGRCYSMITCSPNALVEAVHDRMPALLSVAECEAYLSGRLHQFHPPSELLQLESPAPNPLRIQTPTDPPALTQGELF
ncbi:MAG: SOS response-associated peptidase family protein [Verrucomicrobiales bacterium]|nr:SOS response-associated peptidase family protein [Verrucomicrobiales bacterium]